ncbi:MAG: vWA domain-containing protein [Gaiellales bacterium]
MSLTFLSPLAALAVLAVLLPLGALVRRERRYRRIRNVLALEAPYRRTHVPVAAALVVAFGLLAAAAAQPVVRVEGAVTMRTDAEAFVLIDTTRSMLASPAPDAPTRIRRAIDAASELRRALPDVPFGVASLTNRPLPHLFPTVDLAQFELVLRRAIGINRPPGTSKTPFLVATDFQSLGAIATDNAFGPVSTKRLVILLSDGESGEYAARSIVRELRRGGVELIVVRLWSADERVWRADGTPEEYEPTSFTLPALAELAARTTGGRVYGEVRARRGRRGREAVPGSGAGGRGRDPGPDGLARSLGGARRLRAPRRAAPACPRAVARGKAQPCSGPRTARASRCSGWRTPPASRRWSR